MQAKFTRQAKAALQIAESAARSILPVPRQCPCWRGMHISALRAMAAATAAVAERTLYFQALTCGALQPGCACRRRSWPGAIAGPASGR